MARYIPRAISTRPLPTPASPPTVAPLFLTSTLIASSSRAESHHAAARQPPAADAGPTSPPRRAPPRPCAPLPQSRLLLRQNPLFLHKKPGIRTSSSACNRSLAQPRCFMTRCTFPPPFARAQRATPPPRFMIRSLGACVKPAATVSRVCDAALYAGLPLQLHRERQQQHAFKSHFTRA